MLRNWRAGLYDYPEARERSISKSPGNVATVDLFKVVGGLIKIIDIVGIVTTVIETQANSIKLLIDPDNPATDTDICAALNVTADAVGTVYTITGTYANAMVATTNGVVAPQVTAVLCPPGTIELNATDTNTGVIKWSMYYVAIDPNARVYVA